jgi:hypothetical protein
MRVIPSDIRFSQDSIAQKFSHGHSTTLTELFRQVVAGEISVGNIERISVFRHENSYWVYRGNRRLYLFQKLETYGIIKSIVVNIVPSPFERHDDKVGVSEIVLNLGVRQCCKAHVSFLWEKPELDPSQNPNRSTNNHKNW